MMANGTSELPSERIVDHLQDFVLQSGDVREMLTELATFTPCTLTGPDAALCSIILIRPKKPVIVAGSQEEADRIEQSQNALNRGPSLTAIREREVVHVPDVAIEHRWPGYAAEAARLGVKSSLSVPLILEGEAKAALSLYARRSHGFSGEDIQRIESYAYHVSRALRLGVRISELADAKSNLLAVLESRTTIDLATGALMAQNRCSQDAAMKILKIASMSRNVKLRDLATQVVASVSEEPGVRTYFDA